MHVPFNVRLAGVSFRQDTVAELVEGQQVTVAHDPSNPHDPGAVAVTAAGQLVGYLPAAVAHKVLAVFGDRCRFAGTVQSLSGRETIGVEVRVLGPEPVPSGVGAHVRSRSGRILGRFVRCDAERTVVSGDAGELAYPSAMVTVDL